MRGLGIEVRAGVHTGECELIDGKVGGIAVSIGARISALAGPSQVLVSQTVKDLVAGSGFTFVTAGELELKGGSGQLAAVQRRLAPAGGTARPGSGTLRVPDPPRPP